MAAIAARTKRVQISTDILILPLYHPVKLAEDIATVDLISNGRAMLGVGPGALPSDARMLGIDPATDLFDRLDRPYRLAPGKPLLALFG